MHFDLTIISISVDSSVVGLLQLRVEVCGHTKHLSLSGAIHDGKIVCNKIKHFLVEASAPFYSPT